MHYVNKDRIDFPLCVVDLRNSIEQSKPVLTRGINSRAVIVASSSLGSSIIICIFRCIGSVVRSVDRVVNTQLTN